MRTVFIIFLIFALLCVSGLFPFSERFDSMVNYFSGVMSRMSNLALSILPSQVTLTYDIYFAYTFKRDGLRSGFVIYPDVVGYKYGSDSLVVESRDFNLPPDTFYDILYSRGNITEKFYCSPGSYTGSYGSRLYLTKNSTPYQIDYFGLVFVAFTDFEDACLYVDRYVLNYDGGGGNFTPDYSGGGGRID